MSTGVDVTPLGDDVGTSERSGVMESIIGHNEIKAFAEDRVNLPSVTAKKHRDQVKVCLLYTSRCV